jgi:hypothetical protein
MAFLTLDLIQSDISWSGSTTNATRGLTNIGPGVGMCDIEM